MMMTWCLEIILYDWDTSCLKMIWSPYCHTNCYTQHTHKLPDFTFSQTWVLMLLTSDSYCSTNRLYNVNMYNQNVWVKIKEEFWGESLDFFHNKSLHFDDNALLCIGDNESDNPFCHQICVKILKWKWRKSGKMTVLLLASIVIQFYIVPQY